MGNPIAADFMRQIMNAIIQVCNAGGDASTLATIATNLETLRAHLVNEEIEYKLPDDVFPGDY
jgi:ADP-ribosylglycohydrolase